MLQATDKDAKLQALKNVISTGWPVKRSKLPQNLYTYWDYRDELTVESGVLMKNSKVHTYIFVCLASKVSFHIEYSF